jgi:drug/metabolite transporter (DMT)-like permease
MSDRLPAPIGSALFQLGPVLTAALMFTVSDVSGKVALEGGADVLSLLTFRSFIGLGLILLWLRLGTRAAQLSPRTRRITLALGLLLALNLLGVFWAIALIPVSIAILVYFIYPLLTGLLGAATGIEALSLRGFVIAAVAFFGLALIIGASPGGLAAAGVLAAFFGAVCRSAMLLITRATLAGTDARLVTWYTLFSSMLVFAAIAAAEQDWHWPRGALPWAAFVGVGFTTTIAIAMLYVSTARIGPFRTAIFMNLEPLMTAVLSAIVLGERMTPVQVTGGAIMVAALCAFQMR